MRRHGLTVDNLRSVDLVTADGEQLHVDAETEPELFWGLRGGGGNFGIATAFEYRLHPVGPMVLGGPVFWPLADAPRGAARACATSRPQAPDELGHDAVGAPAPRRCRSCRPEQLRQAGPRAAAGAGPATRPRGSGRSRRCAGRHAARRRVRPLPYRRAAVHARRRRPARHALLLAVPPAPRAHRRRHRRHLRRHRRHHLAAVADQRLGRWAAPSSRVDPDATAVGEREIGFELSSSPAGRRPTRTASATRAWVREGWDALRPAQHRRRTRHFLSDEGAAGVEAAYGDRLERLTALKDRYDPANLFRMNANIPPSGRQGASVLSART